MIRYPLCPFYEAHEKNAVICENRRFDFDYSRDKAMWLATHCCTWDFKICKFYNEQMKKYE